MPEFSDMSFAQRLDFIEDVQRSVRANARLPDAWLDPEMAHALTQADQQEAVHREQELATAQEMIRMLEERHREACGFMGLWQGSDTAQAAAADIETFRQGYRSQWAGAFPFTVALETASLLERAFPGNPGNSAWDDTPL